LLAFPGAPFFPFFTMAICEITPHWACTRVPKCCSTIQTASTFARCFASVHVNNKENNKMNVFSRKTFLETFGHFSDLSFGFKRLFAVIIYNHSSCALDCNHSRVVPAEQQLGMKLFRRAL
jgi:hypothetical protein